MSILTFQTDLHFRARVSPAFAMGGNGLLVGLVSYWIMNEATGATRVDSKGANNLLDHTSAITRVSGTPMAGLGGFGAAAPSQTAGQGLQAASTSAFSVGVGNSFTMNGWIDFSQTNASAYVSLDSGAADGNFGFGLLMDSVTLGAPVFLYYNDNGSTVSGHPVTMTVNNWYMLTLGYDASTKLGFISLNAGARTTMALTTGVKATTCKLTFHNTTNFGETNTDVSTMQDWGYWNRALSTANVSALYAAGAGLPFSSFTN